MDFGKKSGRRTLHCENPGLDYGSANKQIDLKVGDEIILNQKDEKNEAVIKPIAHALQVKNQYGVKKGQQMPEDQSWPLPEFKFE